MKIVRFDDEVSMPLVGPESSGKFATVVVSAGAIRLDIVRLAPGGTLGRRRAESQRLLAVVAGDGWVAGEAEKRRSIGTGYGALFDGGELHDAGTDIGLTAVSVEGTFECRAYVVTTSIEIRDASPEWSGWFEAVCSTVWPVVADIAIRIDHVGSTAVAGLAAKPIIDMDVVVASDERIKPVIDRLASIGYQWRGDLGVEGRQAFFSPDGLDLPPHHLYLVVENSKAHADHWLFRDALRADPDLRFRYADLKRRNQRLADGDMDVYVAAKAAFVAEVLRRAREARGLPAVDYWQPDRGVGNP